MNPQILQQLAGAQSDPVVSALLSNLMEQQKASSESASSELQLRRLKAALRRHREDLAAAQTMLRHIASVFGACEACWGRHPECERCGGHGRPGSAIPIAAELMNWTEPALERLGLCVVPREDRAPRTRSRNQSTKEINPNVR